MQTGLYRINGQKKTVVNIIGVHPVNPRKIQMYVSHDNGQTFTRRKRIYPKTKFEGYLKLGILKTI